MKRSYVLKNSRTGEDMPEKLTTLDVTMTDTDLTFEFYCENSQFFSASDKYNGPLFDGDVCEAFICTDGSRKYYYEIEVAPNGALFLEKITNNLNPSYPNDIIEEPVEDCFLTSEVELLNGGKYKVRFSMSLEKIGYNPDKGILFNAYRIETDGGETDKYLLAVNPTLKDFFHCPECFIELK